MEEGLPEDDELGFGADEDLSYASMFAGAGGNDSHLQETEDSGAAFDSRTPLLDIPELPSGTEKPKPKPGSIALGGLLASTPSGLGESYFGGGMPSSTSSASPFLGTSAPGFLSAPSSQGLGAPSPLGLPYPQPPHPLPEITRTPGPLTPQELEAQLRHRANTGSSAPVLMQQPQQMPILRPMMPPPGMHALPPPPGGFPLPGSTMPHPVGPTPRPGVFTPDMILQMQQQAVQPERVGMGGPPPPPINWGAMPQLGVAGMPPAMAGAAPHINLAQRLRALHTMERPEMHRMPSRRIHASQCMSQDDIESILHMQWRSLHQGAPYLEDYYYQAFLFKHYGKRNKRTFAPESVRELAPTEKMAPDEVAFVKLDGLGRVPFSNIRRPRPLMDVHSHEDKPKAGVHREEGAGGPQSKRPLAQEPMLAARIMIEDCMALILDVQDIDRIFTAASASNGEGIENEAALRQRRVLLMEGLAASLRLPEAAVVINEKGNVSKMEGSSASDGVFLRLISLPKGMDLAAKALLQTYPPAEACDAGFEKNARRANLRILWAILRHLRRIFGNLTSAAPSKTSAADARSAASKIAAATAAVLQRLETKDDVCDALSAIVSGDLCDTELLLGRGGQLPLCAPPVTSGQRDLWLADIIQALLQRAAELEVGAEGATDACSLAWRKNFGIIYDAIKTHLQAIAADPPGTAEGVRASVPLGLVRSLIQHSNEEKAAWMKSMLSTLGV